jgi:hypothetical protein
MSEQLSRSVFERSIQVQGCRFEKSALHIDLVNQDTLVEAGAFLQTVESCSAWWWGDFMVAYCAFRLEQDEADNGRAYDELVRADKLVRYTGDYAEIAKVEAGTLKQRKCVAAFFKPCTRVHGLDYTHHRIAMWGSGGDLAVAQEWLRLAEVNRWKPSELKAAINRKRRRESEPDEPLPQLVLPMEVVECRRWASAAITRVDDMEMEEAKALLIELEGVALVIKALAAKVTANATAIAA